MSAVLIPVIIIVTFLLTLALVGIAKRILEALRVLDVPNERSMHSVSTVRGGGVGIAVALLLVCGFLGLTQELPVSGFVVLIVGLSTLGLVDDLRPLPWWFRLMAQVVLASLFVTISGGFSIPDNSGLEAFLPQVSFLLAVGWIVYMCNIYNFMDGIDGIAAGYGAVCACVTGIWLMLNAGMGAALFCFGLMSACLGFLVWNWEPAKIFLGDSGSVVLGAVLAGIALTGQREYDIPFTAYLILLSVFLADSTFTLLRRLLKGERVWTPHRQHMYQRAVASGLSHASVASLVMVLTVVMSVPATMEAKGIGRSWLWILLTGIVLLGSFIYIRNRERRTAGK